MRAEEWNLAPLPPARPTEADRLFAALVVHVVATATGMEPQAIFAPDRNGASAARARQIAMYLAHTGLDWTQARTGVAFGRDRSTVCHACARVEDLREDPAFDARLCGLEDWLRALPAREAPL